MLTINQVSKFTTLSKATIYRQIKAGNFPRPVRVSVRRVAWVEADILALASKQ